MKIPKIGKEGNSKFVELDTASDEVQAETSPAEIDAKRAAHSLDRAAHLADRGDFAGAILATRQAIALNHDSLEAYGMLGQFLERSGDLRSAAIAYTKALELAPNSVIERASLDRVQERLAESNTAETFSFNDAELGDFSGETTPFDVGLDEENLPARDEGYDFTAPHIEAKLPPTRAELDAAAAANAAVVAAPAVAESARLLENEASPPHIEAALPPTSETAVISNEVSAALPPTSASVVGEALKGDDFFGDGSEPLDLSSFDFPPVAAGPKISPLASAIAADPLLAAASPNRRINGERRRKNEPVLIERRIHADRRAGKVPAVASPFVFQPVLDEPKAPVWAQFLRQPSFFARTLPLIVLTVFSLGFLTWARDRAVARGSENPTVLAQNSGEGLVPTDPVSPQPAAVRPVTPQNTSAQVNPPVSNPSNPNNGFTISNNPMQPGQPASVVTPPTNNVAPATNRPSTTNSSGGNGTRSSGSIPSSRNPLLPSASLEPVTIPPAAIVPAPGSRNSGTGNLGLSRPQITRDEPAEAPVRVLPPDAPSPSQAGDALNPAGSADRGYVRIRSGRLGASAPARPQNQADAAEQAAANAARGGQTDTAIQGLTSAINGNASDAGFRFQQRASLFLERGDYGRAADDFQSAISAYQEQINRGENVSSARSGLRSARSGLNVALAGRR